MPSAYSILKKNPPPPRLIPPPLEMFKTGKEELHRNIGEHNLFNYENHLLTENGICQKFRGITYLCKGFPYIEAIRAIGVVKVAALILLKNINWLKLLTKKSRLSLAVNFCKLADDAISPWPKDEYLCPFARESKKFLTIFFTELGYPIMLADVFAYFMQYDDNYRYRLQDLMSETSADKIGIKEIKRLLKLSIKRDIQNYISKHKFAVCVHFLTIALRLPKVRPAFKKALEGIDFERLKLDEADRYFCLIRSEYDFFGLDFDERYKIFERLTPNIPMIIKV